MSKVIKVFKDQSVRSEYDWKIVLTENGGWAYTTSNVQVGDTVEIEYRDAEFKYYVVRGSINRKGRTK